MILRNLSGKTNFFVGSINKTGPWFKGSGQGLLNCVLNEESGTIEKRKVYPKVENAIWLSYKNKRLCIAHERYLSAGKISSYATGKDGLLTRIGSAQSSLAGALCHLAITPDGRTLFASSFLGGITVHHILPHGALSAAYQIVTYEAHGNKPMQDKSHPHQATVSPDKQFVFVCDLGADIIWMHRVIPKSGSIELGLAKGIPAPAGSGPRHLIFHPTRPLFYLLGQLDGRVHTYIHSDGDWQRIADHDSLPDGFSGEPEAAAIKWHPSRKTLYVSNRNSNTITVFQLEKKIELKRMTCFSTFGKTPRDFGISPSGRWLIVLNLESDNLVTFEINPDTGLPVSGNGKRFDCGSPACIVFTDNS